jgi:hypothetical protein
MSITLTTQPIVANGKLQSADIDALKTALAPLITLPEQETDLTNLLGLVINILPDGTGMISVRFSK